MTEYNKYIRIKQKKHMHFEKFKMHVQDQDKTRPG